MNKALKYSFGAIALYLLVAYKAGPLIASATKGTADVVKSFQGR